METAIKLLAMVAYLAAFFLIIGGISDKLVQPRLNRRTRTWL